MARTTNIRSGPAKEADGRSDGRSDAPPPIWLCPRSTASMRSMWPPPSALAMAVAPASPSALLFSTRRRRAEAVSEVSADARLIAPWSPMALFPCVGPADWTAPPSARREQARQPPLPPSSAHHIVRSAQRRGGARRRRGRRRRRAAACVRGEGQHVLPLSGGVAMRPAPFGISDPPSTTLTPTLCRRCRHCT
jgi:hypothetical protein